MRKTYRLARGDSCRGMQTHIEEVVNIFTTQSQNPTYVIEACNVRSISSILYFWHIVRKPSLPGCPCKRNRLVR